MQLKYMTAVVFLFAGLCSAEEWHDKIDLPFINDPAVIGAWKGVDYVARPEEFDPKTQQFRGDIYLKDLIFLEGGKTTVGWWTWTKGFLIHRGDRVAQKYDIRDIGGNKYIFLEWKNGDYVIRHMKPKYYVLKKMADLRTDNIDLPFVNDPQVLGRWESVDFVEKPEQFDPTAKAWDGDLYLKEMVFLPKGKTGHKWETWTRNYVMHHGDKTASRYEIKTIDGREYMFFEWKSGDYTFRGMAPEYYVLEKAK